MYNFFFLLSILILTEAQNVPPFCGSCSCENDANNQFKVTCSRDIGYVLFNPSYWMNKDTNQTYSYHTLHIHNTPMLNLEKQFPNTSLVVLDLANNSIVNISDRVFSNLQNMEILILTHNNIEYLHPDAFDGQYIDGDFRPLRSLKKLYLDYNWIHTLNEDVFEHTSRVEVLTLSHNPIKIFDQHTIIAINSLPNLKYLDLSHTGLSALPDAFLHAPKYLNVLDLSGNNFQSIPKTLGDTHNLATLFFNDNPVVNLTKENGFPAISTLKILHMCNMPNLLNISRHALSSLDGLEEVYIFDNLKLSHMDKAALSSRKGDAEYETWPPIKKLYLQNNKLTSIDMQLILNWKSLVELDLTGNPWTCECENQWIVDELLPIYLHLDEKKAKELKCAAPIEMEDFSFYDVYKKESTMRCLDLYGHRPERDGTLLVGILAGVLITIPIILFIIYSYQRHWFGVFDGSPASYTRQFYKRTVSNDEYL